MAPLEPDHEEHAREIAHNEVRAFVRLLADELRTDPVGAPATWSTINTALQRYERGEAP